MQNIINSCIRSFVNIEQGKLDPETEKDLDIPYILDNIHCWDRSSGEKIVKSFATLAVQLKENLPYYDTIISDEASGRLVSLFLRNLINRKRLENNKNCVNTYFLAPKKGLYQRNNIEIEKFIQEKSCNMSNVLITTEHIDSGANLRTITKGLEKQNIDFDIASISINQYCDIQRNIGKKIYYASKGKDGLIFSNTVFSGVTKDKIGANEIHPRKREGLDNQRLLNQARRDISLIASEISTLI